jgi:hypothetical protein
MGIKMLRNIRRRIDNVRPTFQVLASIGLTTALTFALATCTSCRAAGVVIVPANPPVITDQSSCAQACTNLALLNCEEAQPIDTHQTCKVDADCLGPTGVHDEYQTCTVAGTCMVTCVNFCTATENTGVWLDPTCAIKITSCAQLSTCPGPQEAGTSCTGPGCKVAPAQK